MIVAETSAWISDAAIGHLPLVLFALCCVGGGLFVCTKGSSEGDEIARDLLHDPCADLAPAIEPPPPSVSAPKQRATAWVIGAVLVGGALMFFKQGTPVQVLSYLLLGALGGEVVHRKVCERRTKDLVRRLEFYLPTAMERVVMAVGAGLDIIPALSEAARKGTDPVSDIFRSIVSLSEGGLRVEYAIEMTAHSVPSYPVKHALSHLSLAYKQGGEVVRPLKELSDATQTQYQESVEEEIAKLPVRAVVPLMLTFTGLIICFLTVPVVQVGASLEKFAHATK
ncbi:MAG: hypothetical protein RL518_1733 [Pseudomonadota bacterium]